MASMMSGSSSWPFGPQRVEQGLTIDEGNPVFRFDLAVGILKIGQAAHRITVAIAGLDEVGVGLVPLTGLQKQLRQFIMRGREAGLAGDQATEPLHPCAGSVVAHARAARNSRANASSDGAQCLRREHRAAGLEAGVVRGRNHETRGRPPRDGRTPRSPRAASGSRHAAPHSSGV